MPVLHHRRSRGTDPLRPSAHVPRLDHRTIWTGQADGGGAPPTRGDRPAWAWGVSRLTGTWNRPGSLLCRADSRVRTTRSTAIRAVPASQPFDRLRRVRSV